MSLFGAPKLFGSSQASTSSNPATVSTGFNVPQTSSSFGAFGFGSNTGAQGSNIFQSPAVKPATSTFTGFGTAPAFQGFGLATTATGLFNTTLTGSVTSQPSFGLFRTQSNQQPSGLLTSSMGVANPLTGNMQQQQQTQFQFNQPQQQLTVQNSVDSFFASLSQPMLFGDERDSIVARWNQLQAMWGTGIGYSALGAVNYTPENTFARFKAIGYNVLPTSTDADGLACLYLARPFTEVTAQLQAIQDVIYRLLGGRPSLQLMIEEVRPCVEAENTTEVILKVVERSNTGTTTTISATELAKYLSSPTVAPQLQSQLCVSRLITEISPSPAQLLAYKENPPAGFDRLIWQQAVLDNSDPDHMTPVPFIGFSDLRRRKLDQFCFGEQQSNMLKHISELVTKMRQGQLTMSQRVIHLKRKQVELSHRVLKVLKHQEVHRRSGFAISAEEEGMRCELERIWTELSAPQGLRTRLQEALSNLRASSELSSRDKENSATFGKTVDSADGKRLWNLDSEAFAELKEYLTQRHSGIREMQLLITDMTNTLKVMEENPVPDIVTCVPNAMPFNPALHNRKVSFGVNSFIR